MDEEKELTTEEKAALIGKTPPDKEEEDIPDYDVKEDDGQEAKEEDHDKRLGKTREGSDHRQLSNREKRQLRKKRLAEKFDAKDALIRQQQEQLNAMASRLNDVDGKLSQVDHESLVRAWNDTSASFQAAEKEHADAFSSGDGAKATAAMRKMYEAQRKLDELQAINARNQSLNSQPRTVANKADPIVVNRAQQWAQDNPWFKQGSNDDDSVIADAIATKLVRDGYDPKSDDYWDELDDRLSQRGIGSQDEDEQEEQTQSQREKQETKPAFKRRSPPVGGGSGRGDLGTGKISVSVPTAYINTLKQNGYWEDVPTRNRMIKRYLDAEKQRQSESR
jgi:hypothetical protein